MSDSWKIYDSLIEQSQSLAENSIIRQVIIGLTWTYCQTETRSKQNMGLAMSPGQYTRTLPWSGTLINRSVEELIPWIKSWNPFEAVIGQAAINSVINTSSNTLLSQSNPIKLSCSANLSVFEHFLPYLQNKKTVVVGRYPGLEQYANKLDLTILERNPVQNDLPDSACEYVLGDADWVFLTASAISNKTFPRLAELAQNAVTVLMGPSVPWIEDWKEYGIDFLAGVRINNPAMLQATVAEGGGVRIFDEAVQYHVVDLGINEMQKLKAGIANLVEQRDQLKRKMDTWYAQNSSGKISRFPQWHLLEQTDRELSVLDLRFKRQWDARYVS